jgi:two-component system NarL family sensor kinase
VSKLLFPLTAMALAVVAGRRTLRVRSTARARAERFDDLVRQERLQQEDIAVRLHDGPLQMVIAARQDLQEHLAGEDVDLEVTIETLAEAVTGLRDLNTDLYDGVLRDSGLEAALQRAAEVTERNGGPPIEVTVGHNAGGLHDNLIVSVTNELLTNIRKHAAASRAWVLVVRGAEDALSITVGDNGVGMTPDVMRDAARAGHIGLRSIERRVVEAGGSLQVRGLGPGTEVELRMPVAAG